MSFWENLWDKNSKQPADTVQSIPLQQIVANAYQPRQEFDPVHISELAQSIQSNGLLQPIVVRPKADQQYELIAGERRLRAVTTLQWEQIPAIVRDYDDNQSASLALIENLQRQNLNPIEEAQAYLNLAQMNQMTQKDLARHLGKSQSYVANKLRLLKLAPAVQTAISQGQISQRHGRALLSLDAQQQQTTLTKIEQNSLTVKQTEQLVQKIKQPVVQKKAQRIRALPSKNAQLSINTVKDAVNLAQKNGAQFSYQEIDGEQEYQLIITVKKENGHG
ncbi:ParB/RepB/Spo0J family partition protein [Bombilactobacillus folatiphilus]|uniref:ParB/RepB/Spo0J family partition protein n=1 Tax=Bombilactobacillus folatiphilus TaxID=2923362 RepID=A0ABY4P9U1_9LACO|nr:ParB/RepB/Spo0J family partition protein [Bombilactobacillus folatiphilus]UQS82167.1 ParB/RepB/Spo0J family partition protein [Bombilactobacillus folatiphilus]